MTTYAVKSTPGFVTAITVVCQISRLSKWITGKSGFDLYLAHRLLAEDYEGHTPIGKMAQGTVLEFSKEQMPSLQVEVRTPMAV